jgi:hypothetical protein
MNKNIVVHLVGTIDSFRKSHEFICFRSFFHKGVQQIYQLFHTFDRLFVSVIVEFAADSLCCTKQTAYFNRY